MFKGKVLVLAFLYLLLSCVTLFAYQLSPLNVTFQPTGVDSSKAYTIINDSDSPIAIEVSAEKRMIDKDGNEYTEPAPHFFSIQPNKMIIKPQSTQIVRVQYRGPKTVTKEMSFRIIAEQIAFSQGVKSDSDSQMINFLFVYSTAAYVAPSKVIEKVESSVIDSGSNLIIKLSNKGSVHQVLNSLEVTIVGDSGTSYKLSEAELSSVNGKNLLTDSTIELVIEKPASLLDSDRFYPEISYDFTYSE